MKEWAISVTASLLIVVLISAIIPEGKTSRIINSVLSLVFLLTVFSPIIKGFNGFFEESEYINSANVEIQTEYISFVAAKNVENKKSVYIEFLKKYGINDVSMQIEYSVNGFDGVEITKIEVTLSSEELNNAGLSANDIIKSVSDYFDCGNVTVVYNA